MSRLKRYLSKFGNILSNYRAPESTQHKLAGRSKELESILKKLQQPSQSIEDDISARINLCRRALTLVDMQTDTKLWFRLLGYYVGLNENILSGSSLNEEAINTEITILMNEQMLQKVPHTVIPDKWADMMYELASAYNNRVLGEQADNLENAINAYQKVLEVRTFDDAPAKWAQTVHDLANAYKKRVLGDRATNIECALNLYHDALKFRTIDVMPTEWMQTMNNLANAYKKRVQGDRADNLEQAIEIFQKALTIAKRDTMPDDWAIIMNNLGRAYEQRIRGSMAENIELAIESYNQALQVRTHDRMLMAWALTMRNLASAYIRRIHGDRDKNLEQAINICHQILQTQNRAKTPIEWANTMVTLADAYSVRLSDDYSVNIEKAIEAIEQALSVITRESMPVEWAGVMNNLGNAYQKRIRGDKAENIENAIFYFKQTLQVYTREAFPWEWAMTQNNLAIAYSERIRGERAENLEQAIHHCQQALHVRTREAFPWEWAMTQNNLAIAYLDRIRGDRDENLERAIYHCQQALEVRTHEAFPQDWAMTQNNLASAYSDRIRGDRAENLERAIDHCQQALEVYTRETFPQDWAMTQNNLASAYSDRIRGDRAENLERAIDHCQQALEVYTRETFPQDWAGTQNNLANAYRERIRGKYAENLERAIDHYQQALAVFQPTAYPEECRGTAGNLARLLDEGEAWADTVSVYQQALAADDVLFRAALDRTGKEEQLARSGDLYRRAAFALAKRGDATTSAETLEKGRTRLLREHLERNRRDLERLPELGYGDLYQRYLEIGQVFQNLLHQARTAVEPTLEQAGFRPDIHTQLEQTQVEIQTVVEEIQTVPGYESFMHSLPVDEIQALAQSAPLVYLLTHETGSLALLVTPHQVEALWSEMDQESLGGLLVAYDGEMVSGGYLPGQLFGSETARTWLEDSLQELLPRLGHDLLAPVAKRLRELRASSVVLIPTGQLGMLPLHAARYEYDGQTHYLQDEFAVSYAPSAQALAATHRWLQRREEELPLLAGVGNPWPQPPPTQSLLFARAELEDIIAQFGEHARPLYEEEATKGALLEEAVPGADYIHLSCHGLFDLENPLQSQLLLAEGTPLTLQEILDEAPFAGARLVVLSACQTGITEFNRLPDEVVGWPAGVLQAEVPGVVGTLWPVNDLSTALLMTRFYEYHLQGDPELGDGPLLPAQALGRAQVWLREVTAGELADYFEMHRALHKAQHQATPSRMPEEVAAAGILLFGLQEEQARPFADKPYHWAPFVFMGV